MNDITFEELKINPSELIETEAALNAGKPWMGLFAKEQISKQLEKTNRSMGDDFRGMILKLINDHVEPVVESITVNTLIGGEPVYGLQGGINDILFVVISDIGRVAFSTDKIIYQDDRPDIMNDGNLWTAFLTAIEEQRYDLIPTIVGWRLGVEGIRQTTENIDTIRKEGGTPCLFVFAGRDVEKQKVGGLLTLLSMPANFAVQKAMAETPLDKSKMN